MIIDGKKIAKDIYDSIKKDTKNLSQKPNLNVIQVGNNESSNRYISQKEKWAKYCGFDFKLHKLPQNTTEEELVKLVKELNTDKNISGFMIQTPLPSQINTNNILSFIDPLKDVDGFHPVNQGKILIGDDSGLKACTPAGIIEILDSLKIDLNGKLVTVIGRSNIVGKPISMLLINSGATVISCNSKTTNLKSHTKVSDIVISAAGVPNLVTKDMIKKDSIIIDVAFSVIDGKIIGDCDFDEIDNNGNLITPVPGGVGPLTVAMLMKNTLKVSKKISYI